jgi:sterol desaturase/sphingolipid hydroxylase (fatty acid hydroxylase superfamily)
MQLMGSHFAGFWFIFSVTLFRYLIIGFIAFTVFYVIKRNKWAYKKIQLRFPAGSDYRREMSYSLLTALCFSIIGYLLFFTPFRNYTKLYSRIPEYGLDYFFGSIVLMLLIHDTYFYWTHRLMHHPAIYKWFHKVHHLSTNPSPWAAYAFHPLEAVVEAGIVVVLALMIPVHPLSIGLFLFIMIIYNVYGHLGYELYPVGFSKNRVGRWINTSVNHNQHHQFFKGNYGLYFLWWDRWMGTLREDYDTQFDEIKNRVPIVDD